MTDYQSIALRRRLARVEREHAQDHDMVAAGSAYLVHREFHQQAAASCRLRAQAYEDRADREEARYATEACR
jgi:hypothetical protein